MDIKRGLFRIWLLIMSGGFLFTAYGLVNDVMNDRDATHSINAMFNATIVIPVILLILGYAVFWAADGFSKNKS